MTFIVQQVALEAVTAIGPLVPRIARHDKNLAVQIRRAASSLVLNTAEGRGNDPGTGRARFHTAAGSAREVRAGLELAVVWGFVKRQDVAPIERALDRTNALLWGLTSRVIFSSTPRTLAMSTHAATSLQLPSAIA